MKNKSKRPKSKSANSFYTPEYKKHQDSEGRVFMPEKVNPETLRKIKAMRDEAKGKQN